MTDGDGARELVERRLETASALLGRPIGPDQPARGARKALQL